MNRELDAIIARFNIDRISTDDFRATLDMIKANLETLQERLEEFERAIELHEARADGKFERLEGYPVSLE